VSVISCDRKPWRGRSGGYQITIGGSTPTSTIDRTIVEIYQVTTDNGGDSAAIVLQDPRVPQALAFHPDWPLCQLTQIQALQDTNNAVNWYVTATYTSQAPRQADQNPLDAPDVVRWSKEPVHLVVDEAFDGGVEDASGNILRASRNEMIAVQNMAADNFDPPIMDPSYDLIATVTRNVAYVPFWAIDYPANPASVNDAPLTFGGIPMDIATLMMHPPDISELKQWNTTFYYEMTMTFAYRARTWDWRIPNMGFNTMDPNGNKKQITVKGVPVSVPQMLDEDGFFIGTGNRDSVTFCVFQRPRDDFSVIRLPAR
jgi:hypothetical protein